MQLMSAENGRSHMFDVSSKPREGVCGKNKEKHHLVFTAMYFLGLSRPVNAVNGLSPGVIS